MTSTSDDRRWKEHLKDLLKITSNTSMDIAESGYFGASLFTTGDEIADISYISTGIQGWTMVLKALDVAGLSLLTCLFDITWTSDARPLDWQTEVAVHLFRKGDWRMSSNYSGITPQPPW